MLHWFLYLLDICLYEDKIILYEDKIILYKDNDIDCPVERIIIQYVMLSMLSLSDRKDIIIKPIKCHRWLKKSTSLGER